MKRRKKTCQEFEKVVNEADKILLKKEEKYVDKFSVDVQNHINKLLTVRVNFSGETKFFCVAHHPSSLLLSGYKIVQNSENT